jgi:hypothetical protein
MVQAAQMMWSARNAAAALASTEFIACCGGHLYMRYKLHLRHITCNSRGAHLVLRPVPDRHRGKLARLQQVTRHCLAHDSQP